MTNKSRGAQIEEIFAPRWGAIFSLSFGVATMITAELLPASLLPRIAQGLQISEGAAGQSIAATAIVALFSSLFVTTVTRGLDRRFVVIAFSALLIASSLLVASAVNYPMMLVGRVLLGLGVGGFWAMAASLAMRLVPEKDVAKALAIVFGGVSVSMVVAAPLGSFLGEVFGWRGVFYIVAGLGFLCLVWQAVTLPSLPNLGPGNVGAVFAVLKKPGVAVPMLAIFTVFAGQFAFFTYMRPFFEQVTGLQIQGVSTILLLFGVANFLGTSLSAKALAKSVKATLAIAPVVLAACAAILIVEGTVPSIVFVIIAVWGFAFGFVPVGWSTWVALSMSDDAENGGGMQVAVIQIANTVGAAVGGFSLDVSGPIAPVVLAGLLLTVTSGLVMVGVGRMRPVIDATAVR